MNHLDLCSGIGGFALAASRVWPEGSPSPHRVLSFVEIDPWCRAVLRKHWPDAPQHDDLKTFDARPLRGRVDLLTGGYPCQPFSFAGARLGDADPRHLWPDVRRVVADARPRWCLFENVAGHVTLGLDVVLADLEGLGYACEAAVIPACGVDSPQLRERVWILAHADGTSPDAHAAARPQRRPARQRPRWPREPRVGRVADGVPAGVDRNRALGNAIVPAVAEEILRAIDAADLTHALPS